MSSSPSIGGRHFEKQLGDWIYGRWVIWQSRGQRDVLPYCPDGIRLVRRRFVPYLIVAFPLLSRAPVADGSWPLLGSGLGRKRHERRHYPVRVRRLIAYPGYGRH